MPTHGDIATQEESLSQNERTPWRERICVLVILIAALFARARDFRAPFDREFEGYQAAFFAIGAVNYERLGLARAGGYPVLNIELGARDDAARGIWNHPERWVIYANHPPLVPLLAWSAIALAAPDEWSEAWKDARAPRGIEPVIRAPFLLASMLSLFALWWAVRQAASARRALIALSIAAALPIAVVYGTLVNYENPALLCVLVAAGFFARWIRRERARDLCWCAAAFAAGSCVTFAGLFFVPPLIVVAWSRRGARKAGLFAVASLAAGCAPVFVHAAWSRTAQERLGSSPASLDARARELLAPLLDGSHPLREWASLQGARIVEWFTWPVAAAACLGLVVSLVLLVKSRAAGSEPKDRELDLEFAWLCGGALYLLAFYRHTLDPQFTFLILLMPGIVGLAALALDRLARRIAMPNIARAVLVLSVAALATFSALRCEDLRFDRRARPGETHSTRAAPPLELPDVTGAEIATLVPAGGFAIHPTCVGLNLAVSYYAWRSLWPADSASDPIPNEVARRFGLGAAPHVLLLPKDPWPSIAARIFEFEKTLVNGEAPDRESAHWRAWDLH